MLLEAAEKNFLTLKCHNLDLGAAIQAQSKSPVGYGSEFWKPSVLAPLLGNHPLWASMKGILDNGLQWPINPITKEESIDRNCDVLPLLKFCTYVQANIGFAAEAVFFVGGGGGVSPKERV